MLHRAQCCGIVLCVEGLELNSSGTYLDKPKSLNSTRLIGSFFDNSVEVNRGKVYV